MRQFEAKQNVTNSQLILDGDNWPNFHDAEVENLTIWRGDVRPDDNVWIGPVITASFDLCALQRPYRVILRFHDCEQIQMQQFNHQNALFDLNFEFESRGITDKGMPLTPYIVVQFEQAFGMALSFKCFRVEALERQTIENETNAG